MTNSYVTLIFFAVLLGIALADSVETETNELERKYENYTKSDFIEEIKKLNEIIEEKDGEIKRKTFKGESCENQAEALNGLLYEKFRAAYKKNLISIENYKYLYLPPNILKYFYINEFHTEFYEECLEDKIDGNLAKQYHTFMSLSYLQNVTSKCSNISYILQEEIKNKNLTVEEFPQLIAKFATFYHSMYKKYLSTMFKNDDSSTFLAWLVEYHPDVHNKMFEIFTDAHSTVRKNGLCIYCIGED